MYIYANFGCVRQRLVEEAQSGVHAQNFVVLQDALAGNRQPAFQDGSII
jgi:hypothetical protein